MSSTILKTVIIQAKVTKRSSGKVIKGLKINTDNYALKEHGSYGAARQYLIDTKDPDYLNMVKLIDSGIYQLEINEVSTKKNFFVKERLDTHQRAYNPEHMINITR